MKKSAAILLFFLSAALIAEDYKWDLVNALIRNDYPVIENIITQNINRVHVSERSLIMNFTVTYSRGDTTLSVLNLLQRYNIRPNAYDLYTAFNRNQSDTVVQYILGTGVNANGEILLLAMEKQRYNFAEQFIRAGVDVNYQYPLSRSYSDGMTPLMHAARSNNFELVQLLVERGAIVNARNRDGNNAFTIAQMNGFTQIGDFLTERGASQVIISPVQNYNQNLSPGGIAGFIETQISEFQPGTYRLSGGTRDIRFIGTANYGNLSFLNNNRLYNGAYQANNGSLTMIMDGRMFVYRVDSLTSFSGNGETWMRIGN